MRKSKRTVVALALLLTIAIAVQYYMQKSPLTPDLNQVTSWGYQLQNLQLDELDRVEVDLLVVDHAADNGAPLSKDRIARLKQNPDGSRRVVLSYLSIGEAERYRPYWDARWETAPPDWLGPENPRWPGNYTVDFAASDWQRHIFGQTGALLDTILDQGFDGVYLDRVDAYYGLGAERRAEMIEFVAQLGAYARRQNPGFLIFQQNAEELLTDASHRANIDGLAKEDLLYNVGEPGAANRTSMVAESTRLIELIAQENKPVLVVEYDLDPDQAKEAERIIDDLGYVLTIANRSLSNTPH